jgi:hypothetical protein
MAFLLALPGSTGFALTKEQRFFGARKTPAEASHPIIIKA